MATVQLKKNVTQKNRKLMLNNSFECCSSISHAE